MTFWIEVTSAVDNRKRTAFRTASLQRIRNNDDNNTNIKKRNSQTGTYRGKYKNCNNTTAVDARDAGWIGRCLYGGASSTI